MMAPHADTVLIIGSGPNATDAARYPRAEFDTIVCINNAWRVRPDWDYSIFSTDFPPGKRPTDPSDDQALISNAEYLPAMNRFGGLPLCGATMAFAAGYWVLSALRPRVVAFIGCDMDYRPQAGKTHFYGTGTADPLRKNISLRDLGAKSGRLFLKGLAANTMFVNLSRARRSRLAFPRADVADVRQHTCRGSLSPNVLRSREAWTALALALRAAFLETIAPREFTRSDEYWLFNDREDIRVVVDRIDGLWKRAALGATETWSVSPRGGSRLRRPG